MTSQNRLFNFIEKVSKDLFDLITQLEEALFKQPQTVLMQARLYTEQLVKLVSKEEGLEDIYSIKHNERIYKLYHQNAIEEEIYIKIEWIRKKGNKAAHDVSSVSYEDAFKAHKYLFDISVWYMQLYINYDFESPIYKLPIAHEGKKIVSEQDLNEAIKPFLDQSFKQMDEMRKEVQRELEELKKVQSGAMTKESTRQELIDLGNHFPLLEYLQEQDISYIDKRDNKGALWVIGAWELSEKLLPLKVHKIYFRYSKRGARVTKFEPAWFLLNKNLNELPTAETSHLQTEQLNEENVLEELPKEKQTAVSLEVVTVDYWKKTGQLLVPYSLLDQEMNQLSLEGIQRLLKHISVCTFRDLTEDHLRDLYKTSREDFHYTVQDLYGLGCRFLDRLAPFQPVPMSGPEHRFIVEGTRQEELQSLLPFHIAKTLTANGLYHVKDLHDCLSESVKWITKVDPQDIVNLLSHSYQEPIKSTSEKEKAVIEAAGEPSQSIVLSFLGEDLEIRRELSQIPIDELGIAGCDNMIQQFLHMDMKTLVDFEKVLDNLHLRVKGVGAKTVEKFWKQLAELNGNESPDLQPSFDSDGNKLIYLYGKTLVIPTYLHSSTLQTKDFPGADYAIESMVEKGLNTLGDLPTQFEELKQLDGVGKTKLERIFDRLQTLIELTTEQYQLEQLPPAERLTEEVALFEKWMVRLQRDEKFLKGEKISPRYLQLMHVRFEAFLKGQHVTLEALGEKDGVTRERIRQILSKGSKRVARRLTEVQYLLQEILRNSNHLVLAKFMNSSSFPHFILKNALEEAEFSFVSIDGHMLLSDQGKEKIDEYELEIKGDIEKHFHLHVITPKDFQSYCKEKAEEDGIDINIINLLASPYIKWLSTEQAVLQNLKKYQSVEMVMLQYPEGVEVYKREDELNAKANDLMPGEFTDKRDFCAIATRSDLADRIYLWDRGLYIHSAFVTKDKEWVHQVQRTAEKWLEEEDDLIHVAKLYEAVKEEALERKVLSEYALYTLIRHYSLESLALIRFPMIQLAGVERQENAHYIEQFIRENGGRASFQEMLELFVEKRGWKKFTLEFTLSTKEQFVQYRYGHWTLFSNYEHIQLEDIPFIEEAIQEKANTASFFSVHTIFTQHEVILKSIGIETKQILHAVLKKMDGLPVRFIRYPYIVSTTHEVDTISGIGYIEQFILEQEDIVAREDAEAWVEDVFGQNDRILDIALVQVPDILYYTKGRYGEYIHRKNIGIHEEKEALVHEAMYQRFDTVVQSKERSYGLLSELYVSSVLPNLNEGYYWSQDLLGDVLKKSGKWIVIGSYDDIFVPAGHEITDDVSFLEYILSHHFDGSAKLREFQRFLGDIRYSKDGKLLYAVEEAMRTGEASYEIDGDEIMLIKLSKGASK